MAGRSAIRFGSHLKELRVHLCQTSPESQGLRDFITKSYPDIKKANPTTPILIRECSGTSPRIWARHEFGKEVNADVTGLKADDIYTTLEKLASPLK